MITKEEALKILNAGFTLELAIEGKFTNLRIWLSHDGPGKHGTKPVDTIFIRLDRVNCYSACLSEETAKYLEKPNNIINQLVRFGFKSDVKNLPEILEIIEGMKVRPCIKW